MRPAGGRRPRRTGSVKALANVELGARKVEVQNVEWLARRWGGVGAVKDGGAIRFQRSAISINYINGAVGWGGGNAFGELRDFCPTCLTRSRLLPRTPGLSRGFFKKNMDG